MSNERTRLPLPGIGMGGYRSLRELQTLGSLRKVTLVAGQNNAGKSNILRFVSHLLASPVPGLEWFDEPQPPGPPLLMQLAHVGLDAESLRRRFNKLSSAAALAEVFNHQIFHPVPGDEVWINYSVHGNRAWVIDEQFLTDVVALGNRVAQALRSASMELHGQGGGAPTADAQRVFRSLFDFSAPSVVTVGAFRQITNGVSDSSDSGLPDDFSGRNLVRRLGQLESPPADRYAVDRAKFDAITRFAQTVLEDRDVTIRIPAAQDVIQVHQNGRALPLPSLGTGIHQVIILAAAATLLEGTVICIEEPEVHLHPLLQRKLVRYLSDATSNQYLIATHSAHMLDYENATVLHIKHEYERGTLIAPAETLQDVSNLCSDLGYRPSDLIQSNAVLWVEGPSDRIYLRHWLEMAAPGEFVEGIHYSIMFYGGGLLRHLTADDPSVDEFISLRRLNRHSAILIDSDLTSPSGTINDTKKRICEEFEREDMPGFAWVTACRTIENYVPAATLLSAVNDVHNRSDFAPARTRWQEPLKIMSRKARADAKSVRVTPDKVKIARIACQAWPADEMPLDLPSRIEQAIEFIRTANGFSGPMP